jgi:imidazole glycerol-phosphate synthase subunit HisH
MSVLIIDYGMGNLGSVRRSFEECGADVRVSSDPAELGAVSRVVLPGVGVFEKGMRQLIQRGWVDAIRKMVEEKIPFLGICLGMQLLAEKGCEGGACPGLGIISGEVARLSSKFSDERIPHVGWNDVCFSQVSPLFSEIPNNSDFYFVHSYHLIPRNSNHVMATTPYCGGVVSAVRDENVFGVQFHPEKSSKPGRQLLKNFLKV